MRLALSELPEASVLALKRYLVQKHFEKRCSRFQLRILKEGDARELPDHEALTESMTLQLMLLKHLEADEERDMIFLDQCLMGEVEEVEASLRALQDPSTCLSDGSALCLAVDHVEVLQLLLEAAADPEVADDHRMTALHEAATRGHDQAVELLLDFRANMEAKDHQGRRPLHLAAYGGHLDVLCRLLQSGAHLEAIDFQALRPLHLAATIGHEEIVRILLNNGVSWSFKEPLWILLDSPIIAKKLKETAVYLLRIIMNDIILELKIAHCPKVDKEASTSTGLRALHLAAEGGHLEAVRYLLDFGAQRKAESPCGTPSDMAARRSDDEYGHLELMALLDSSGR